MENGNPRNKSGNPVYLGVPLLFRRLLKKGGLLLPCQHYIALLCKFEVHYYYAANLRCPGQRIDYQPPRQVETKLRELCTADYADLYLPSDFWGPATCTM